MSSKLNATASEWKPPGGDFKLPPANSSDFVPPSDAINFNEGPDPYYLGGGYGRGGGSSHGGGDGGGGWVGGGGHTPPPPPPPPPQYLPGEMYGDDGQGLLSEADEATYQWNQVVSQARQDHHSVMWEGHGTGERELDEQTIMELYAEMLQTQKELIEQQLADEAAYEEGLKERQRKQQEEYEAKKKEMEKNRRNNQRNGGGGGGGGGPRHDREDRDRGSSKQSATKQQKEQFKSQKSGFETFSQALLNGASPFMPPLRARCGTSLPHIKVDQRFGKRGQPATAVTQFIIAPVVSNYRPTNFHEVTPGDLMEYHHDLSLVLQAIPSASAIMLSYGEEWKPFAIPYCFLNCKDYKKEVLDLCPNEAPNAKADAIYEDDLLKDVTQLLLAIPELSILKKQSFLKACNKRANLTPLYHVFNDLFSGLKNYQIQIRNLNRTPSTFLLKVSENALQDVPRPIMIAGDAELWEELPIVSNTFASAGTTATSQEGEVEVGPNQSLATDARKSGPPPVATANAAPPSVDVAEVAPPVGKRTGVSSSTPSPSPSTSGSKAPKSSKGHNHKSNAQDNRSSGDNNSSNAMAISIAISSVCIATAVVAVVLLRKK